VGYQHYPPPWRLWTEAPTAALVLWAIQVTAVALGVWSHRAALRRLASAVGPMRLAAAAGLCVAVSAALSRRPDQYAAELGFASLVQLVHLANVALVTAALPAQFLKRFEQLITGRLGATPENQAPEAGSPDRFAWLLALWTTVAAAALALAAYQRHPHVPDEVSYLIQARYLAHGMVAMPAPPVPDAFNLDLMQFEPTRWFSPFPPGWPVVLGLGVLIGVPWLVNPVLGGLAVVLAYQVLREFYPLRTARLAAVLLAASPWHLFMSMSFMSHTIGLGAALAGALAMAQFRKGGLAGWTWVAGAAAGFLTLVRPLEGLAAGALLGAWLLWPGGSGRRLTGLTGLALGGAALGALNIPYNLALTGTPTRFPVMAYFDVYYGPGVNDLGFGANRGVGWTGLDPFPGHGPQDVLINAALNTFQINVDLLGWATGSLLLPALLLVGGPWRRSDTRMLAAILLIAGVHSFYWFSGGPDFGARYWYLVIVPCLALAARGLEALAGAVTRAGYPHAETRTVAALAALVAAATAVFVPWRAADKYHHYRGMEPGIRRLAARHPLGDGIVLVRGRRHPDYASAAVYNPLDPAARRPVYVWDRSDRDVRTPLARAYPERSFWIVDGPTVTGGSYRVVAGPLTAAQLLARQEAATATRPTP
jgi:hypothetical protein